MSLATVSDYTELLAVSLNAAEEAQVQRYLDSASEAVVAFAHHPISQTTDTVTVPPTDGLVWLPGVPVVSVASVTEDGIVLDTDQYTLTPGGEGRSATLARLDDYGEQTPWRYDITVEYTYGFAEVPETVKVAVCGMAAQSIRAMAEDLDKQSETIQPGYSFTRFKQPEVGRMEVPGWMMSYLEELIGIRGPLSIEALR